MFYRTHVSVVPVLSMDWRTAERYFRKDEPNDGRHWQLTDTSINSVLRLARMQKAKYRYIPGREHPRSAREQCDYMVVSRARPEWVYLH